MLSFLRHTAYIIIAIASLNATHAMAFEKPDLDKIKAESTNPKSKFYFPSLCKLFLANDTIMTNEDYTYFYYGALFQEDFDPYRPSYNEEELKKLIPLYDKASHDRHERQQMEDYARDALEDNPLDLVQLKNLVYIFEKNKKVNLAKIWMTKLNHLLQVIGMSGNGLTKESAWYIVYPRHEFDFLNVAGIPVQATEFEEPYYEKVTVPAKSEKDPGAYYFNLQPVLEQYYLKHPSEAD